MLLRNMHAKSQRHKVLYLLPQIKGLKSLKKICLNLQNLRETKTLRLCDFARLNPTLQTQ